MIWIDTDGCESVSQYCKYFLTSVTKDLSGAVEDYVTKAATGTFPTGNYTGTLENNGTGLAPYHDFDSKVPSDLKDQIDAGQGRHHLRQDQDHVAQPASVSSTPETVAVRRSMTGGGASVARCSPWSCSSLTKERYP